MCGYIIQYSQARVTAWSNYFQKEHRIMQKCFLHYSLASRRPWAAPADLFFKIPLENSLQGAVRPAVKKNVDFELHNH